MRIKGRTVQLFLPIFLKYYSPTASYSKTSTITIFNILESYAQIGSSNPSKKISVSDIVKRSGYSRTTFYSYFMDVKEISDLLEEMVAYHMYINSDVYLNCFLGKLTAAEEDEVLLCIGNFSPYIRTLLTQSKDYETRYKELFGQAMEKALSVNKLSADAHVLLSKSISSSMVYMITEHLKDNKNVSLRTAMDCAKVIVQSIISK